MGCGASKTTSALAELEKRQKKTAKRGRDDASSPARKAKPKKVVAIEDLADDDSATHPISNDGSDRAHANQLSKGENGSSAIAKDQVHENGSGNGGVPPPQTLLHDWRKTTDNEMHTRVIRRHSDTGPSDTDGGVPSVDVQPSRRRRATDSHRRGSVPARPTDAHDDDANSSSSDSETDDKEKASPRTRKAKAKHGRVTRMSRRGGPEPSLPGAVSDDEDAAPLLAMFRPKSALNVDLD